MARVIDDAIEIRVPCKPEYVRTIRHAIADFAESVDMPRSDVEEVEIAASEAVANIVRHAYSGLDSPIPPVRVKCSHGRGKLTVEVIDRGRGFSAPAAGVIPEVDLNRDGGLGIVLIKCLMDRVNYASKPNGGTRIRMTKRARQAVRNATRVRVARLAGEGSIAKARKRESAKREAS
jgi:anti-sigma regulatory factor (Ser/Thr protein kinase)